MFDYFGVSVGVGVTPAMFCVDSMMMSYPGDDDFNPNSKQDDPSYQTCYYHSPSPLICNEIDIFGDSFSSLHDELAVIQHPSLGPNNSTIVTDDDSTIAVITNKMDSKNNQVTKPSSGGLGLKRRRTSKRDRHSKIRTAHGLRDRRMRLSLDVACPFFKLQDMLGYDKASSTVEWLLVQAKPAIQELFQGRNNAISSSGVTKSSMSNATSNCEVESSTVAEEKKGKRASSTVVAKDKQPKQKRKSTTKEARKEARARARIRTLERLQSRGPKGNESNSQTHNNGGNNSMETPQDIIDPGSLTTEDWSPLASFAYQPSEIISQSCVPGYRISMQQNIIGGPR